MRKLRSTGCELLPDHGDVAGVGTNEASVDGAERLIKE